MANWKHKLKLKDLLVYHGPDFDYDTQALEIAPIAASRVQTLMDRLDKASALFEELGYIRDAFSDTECSDDFNDALEMLYDVGDYKHNLWIH